MPIGGTGGREGVVLCERDGNRGVEKKRLEKGSAHGGGGGEGMRGKEGDATAGVGGGAEGKAEEPAGGKGGGGGGGEQEKRGDSQDCGESGQGWGGGSVLGKKRTIRESEPRAGRKRWRPRRRRWEDDGNKTKKRR